MKLQSKYSWEKSFDHKEIIRTFLLRIFMLLVKQLIARIT